MTQGSIWDQTTEQQQKATEEHVVSRCLYKQSQHTAHGAACSSALSQVAFSVSSVVITKTLLSEATRQQNSPGVTPHLSSNQLQNGQFYFSGSFQKHVCAVPDNSGPPSLCFGGPTPGILTAMTRMGKFKHGRKGLRSAHPGANS